MKHKNMLKKEEIQKVISGGNLVKLETLLCYWQKKEQPELKLAIAISKKIKPICKKNKVKRQLRAIITKQINWKQSLNLIFIAKANYFNFNFIATSKEIGNLLQQVTTKSSK